MRVRYDSNADVVFVVLREPEGGESGGERIDERRYAHFDRADRVFAYECATGAGRPVREHGCVDRGY